MLGRDKFLFTWRDFDDVWSFGLAAYYDIGRIEYLRLCIRLETPGSTPGKTELRAGDGKGFAHTESLRRAAVRVGKFLMSLYLRTFECSGPVNAQAVALQGFLNRRCSMFLVDMFVCFAVCLATSVTSPKMNMNDRWLASVVMKLHYNGINAFKALSELQEASLNVMYNSSYSVTRAGHDNGVLQVQQRR